MRCSFKLLFFAIFLSINTQAFSNDYPDRPIRITVPFAAGGITDVISRVIAGEMSQNIGQSVVVDNKPGAGGSLGAGQLAKALPDGYSLGVSNNGNMAANKFLYREIGYDPERDFVHLSILFSVPYMIISNERSGIATISDLIERSRVEKLSMANGGYGTAVHLMAESFSKAADVDILHIPYKGEAPAVTDVLGGHTAVGISSYSSISQHIASGKINVLAVTAKERLSILPDVPTLAELGYELPINEAWFGIAAPKGINDEVVDRLHKSIDSSLRSREVTERINQIGGTIANLNPAEAAEFIKNEIPRWERVIKQANIQPN